MESPLVYLVILGALASYLTSLAWRWRSARGELPGHLAALVAGFFASLFLVLFLWNDDLALLRFRDEETWFWIGIFFILFGILAYIANLGAIRFYRSESSSVVSAEIEPEAHLLIERPSQSFFRRCVSDNVLSLVFGGVLWIQAIVTRVTEPNLEGFGSGRFWFGMGCICLSPFAAYLFVAFIARVTKPRPPAKQ